MPLMRLRTFVEVYRFLLTQPAVSAAPGIARATTREALREKAVLRARFHPVPSNAAASQRRVFVKSEAFREESLATRATAAPVFCIFACGEPVS